MDIEVNYKNKARYKYNSRYPMHQSKFWTGVIWFLSKIMLIGKKYSIEKIDMEGLKPPYMLLSNHMHFIDFEITAMATGSHSISNVVSIDGYVGKFFLLEWIGAICTRKYTTDLHLVKSIRKVLQRGDVLAMYPEARYTPCGTLSFLPESLGKLIKMNKVPVVTVVHHGNHLYAPFWNVFKKKKNVPMHAVYKKILTPEQINTMSVQEINDLLKKELQYDEYRYQKKSGIRITEPFRAEGMHKVLYKCPHCGAEAMDSQGAEIFCTECGKRWLWQEDGYLKATEGETEFDHIPDWFAWERAQVEKEIEEGTYYFEDEVDVLSLPHIWKYVPLGKAKVTHDPVNGFQLEGHYRGQRYYINRKPEQTNSLHVEYNFTPIDGKDYLDISTENDSFYCRPSKPNVITKLAFATEILYLRSQEK